MPTSKSLRCVAAAALLAVACAPPQPPPDPYAPVATPWDDVPTAALCNPQDPGQNCLEPTQQGFALQT